MFNKCSAKNATTCLTTEIFNSLLSFSYDTANKTCLIPRRLIYTSVCCDFLKCPAMFSDNHIYVEDSSTYIFWNYLNIIESFRNISYFVYKVWNTLSSKICFRCGSVLLSSQIHSSTQNRSEEKHIGSTMGSLHCSSACIMQWRLWQVCYPKPQCLC